MCQLCRRHLPLTCAAVLEAFSDDGWLSGTPPAGSWPNWPNPSLGGALGADKDWGAVMAWREGGAVTAACCGGAVRAWRVGRPVIAWRTGGPVRAGCLGAPLRPGGATTITSRSWCFYNLSNERYHYLYTMMDTFTFRWQPYITGNENMTSFIYSHPRKKDKNELMFELIQNMTTHDMVTIRGCKTNHSFGDITLFSGHLLLLNCCFDGTTCWIPLKKLRLIHPSIEISFKTRLSLIIVSLTLSN